MIPPKPPFPNSDLAEEAEEKFIRGGDAQDPRGEEYIELEYENFRIAIWI